MTPMRLTTYSESVMKNQRFLLSVSIDEFSSLLHSGYLRVDGNRLVVGSPNLASPELITSLLSRMPEFMDSDEHAVLILAFDLSTKPAGCPSLATSHPDFRHVLVAENCQEIIPLTSLAKSLLEGRFGKQIVLGEPVFEAVMVNLFKDRIRLRSLRGGDALVRCLVDLAGRSIPEDLIECATREPGNGFDAIALTLNFTRRKPMVREPISGLRDLGGILIEGLTDKTAPDSLLLELSRWLKPRQDTWTGFSKVYGDSGLMDLLGRITQKHSLPTHAASLGIFLHWRDLAIKVGGLDLDALEGDCRELAGCVPGTVLIDALWLLGFNAGLEKFSEAYYERLPQRHPFAAKQKRRQPLTLLWQLTQTPFAEMVREEPPLSQVACAQSEPEPQRRVEQATEKDKDLSSVVEDVSAPIPPESPETTDAGVVASTEGVVTPPAIVSEQEPVIASQPELDSAAAVVVQTSLNQVVEPESSQSEASKTTKPGITRKSTASKKPNIAKKGKDSGSEPTLHLD